jgi:hypothetical protein
VKCAAQGNFRNSQGKRRDLRSCRLEGGRFACHPAAVTRAWRRDAAAPAVAKNKPGSDSLRTGKTTGNILKLVSPIGSMYRRAFEHRFCKQLKRSSGFFAVFRSLPKTVYPIKYNTKL